MLELVGILANITAYSSSEEEKKEKKKVSEKPAQYIRLVNNNDRCGRLRGIQRALFIPYNEQKFGNHPAALYTSGRMKEGDKSAHSSIN